MNSTKTVVLSIIAILFFNAVNADARYDDDGDDENEELLRLAQRALAANRRAQIAIEKFIRAISGGGKVQSRHFGFGAPGDFGGAGAGGGGYGGEGYGDGSGTGVGGGDYGGEGYGIGPKVPSASAGGGGRPGAGGGMMDPMSIMTMPMQVMSGFMGGQGR